jgi:hypothetical protein
MTSEALFSEGAPVKITANDFKRAYLASFPKFTDTRLDSIIDDSIDAVYAMFNGVQHLFDHEARQEWYDKTVRCYKLLTAWYIADMYPKYASGIKQLGGITVSRKKIGDVDITYNTGQKRSTAEEVLDALKSNDFGVKALMMIRSSGKRIKIQVSGFV